MRVAISPITGCLSVVIALFGVVACTQPRPPPDPGLLAPDANYWPEKPAHLRSFPTSSNSWQLSIGNDRIQGNRSELKMLDAPLRFMDEPVSDKSSADWLVKIHEWRQSKVVKNGWVSANPSPNQAYFLVFVSPDCDVCNSVLSRWPSELPIKVIPLSSVGSSQSDPVPTTFASHWCAFGKPSELCSSMLWENAQAATHLGVLMSPALIAPDGRILAGWPDANWLRLWWNPKAHLGPDAQPLVDPDL